MRQTASYENMIEEDVTQMGIQWTFKGHGTL